MGVSKMHSIRKWIQILGLTLSSITILTLITSCTPSTPEVSCTQNGSSSLFASDFDNDVIAALPAPSGPLVYGPPGAELNIMGSSGTVEVVNDLDFTSNVLKITRAMSDTNVEAVIGDIGEGPYDSGPLFVDFLAQGEVIPVNFISGLGFSIESEKGKSALFLKLYDNAYHTLGSDGNYTTLSGSYDPNSVHHVRIFLEMDEKLYAVCIDGEPVQNYTPFLDQDFGELRMAKLIAPPTVTEAFEMVYLIDEFRIIK